MHRTVPTQRARVVLRFDYPQLQALLAIAVVSLTVVVLASVARPASAKVSGPNGLIAFTRTDFNLGSDATYIMNSDGTHLRPVLGGAEASVPHWSPSGSLLALQTSFGGACPPCSSTTILNPDTGSYRVLSPPDPTLFTGCSIWSPDATHFACEMESPDGSRDGIYTIRTSDGGGLTQITSNPGGADVPIDYSPDGKQIVFGRDDINHNCTTTSALYVVNIDGTGLHQITPGGFCDDDGSWSPNGKAIAFATTTSTSCFTASPRRGCRTGGSIYVVHPDGTGLTKVPLGTDSRAFAGDVSWSPDGTKIAFILSTPVGRPEGGPSSNFQEGIATANADGTDVQQLTTVPFPLFDHETDWGPHPRITP